MELLFSGWDLLVHLDRHLATLLEQHGAWVYLLLFVIIFCETGLVVTPFLPGDSLLFIAGTLAAGGGIDVHLIAVLLVAAAALGNTVNYSIGRFIGPKVFHWEESRLFNRRALDRAHAFYEKHGGKTIVITRFVPILRTFAPFVAGIARMTYLSFTAYNLAGALAWVLSLLYAGYWFGNVPFVKENLTIVIVGIVVLSVTPLAFEYLRQRLKRA
ncbi:MAG: DedA family protein [Betaproteobacteria bacterium]|nr:MAG: DedA family protein [Betaproteobacteria bacterium]TMH93405.1 MAG: DedA family protein [Betaproteobacteria bacterium]